MANRIKGITIEINGSVTGLDKALKETNSKLSETKRALGDVDRLLKLDPGNVDLLRQKQKYLTDAIDETKRKLDTEKEALQQLKDADRSPEVERQMEALQRQIAADTQELEKLIDKEKDFGSVAGQQIQAAGEKMQNVGDKISDVGGKLTRNVTVPIVGIGTAIVKTAADFESQMSTVQAITGATGDEIGQLEDKAREMGENTVFSATEAAEAFEYMGMAGWETQDMISGIDGILNLAAAAGADLATTSDIVTDALTGFGKEAKDAGHFADVMAAAATNANTNVEMMGETFKYVAPVAGAMGYSMEDVSLAVGLMANSGIKASQAGTSLKTLMSNLAHPIGQAKTAVEELGIALDDGHGKMKSWREVMDELRDKMGDMKMSSEDVNAALEELSNQLEAGEISQSEFDDGVQQLAENCYGAEGAMKAQSAAMLAGKEGMAGLLAIVNASEEDYNKLADAIENCSYNLDEVSDAVENSGVEWGKYADKAWMAVDDGIRGLADTIAHELRDVGTSAEDLQQYLMMEYGLDADDAIAAIDAVGESAKGTAEEMSKIKQENLESQIKILVSQLQELAISLGETLIPIAKDVVEYIQKVTDKLNGMDPKTKDLIVKAGLILAVVGPLLSGLGGMISTIGGLTSGIGGVIGKVDKAASKAGGLIPMLVELGGKAAPYLAGGAIIVGLIAGIVLIVKHWDEIKAKAGELKEAVSEKWNAIKDKTAEAWDAVKTKTSEAWDAVKTKTSESWDAVKTKTHETWEAVKSKTSEVWGAVQQFISEKAEAIRQTASSKIESAKEKISNAWEQTKSKSSAAWDAMKSTVSNAGNAILSNVGERFDAIRSRIAEKMDAAKQKVSEAIEAIKSKFNFRWKLPDLKLPHIRIDGYIDVPVLGRIPNPAGIHVDWYAKAMNNPMLLRRPTAFGFDPQTGAIMAGGEAGDEVVSGASTLMDMIRNTMESVQRMSESRWYDNMQQALQTAAVSVSYGDVNMTVNGAEGQDVHDLADIIQQKITDAYTRDRAVWR